MDIRSRGLHRGSYWSRDDNGREVEGDVYCLVRSGEPWRDPQFVYDAFRKRWWALPEKGEVTETAQLEALNAVREDDAKICEEWRVFANERAGKDRILADIILWHLHYSNGSLTEPRVVDGISFWEVGHNASHSFSIGCKDGKRYARSCTCDDEGKEIAHVREVPSDEDWGYLGHF